MEEQIISLPHGGDWAGFAAECGALPLDFSASVSPLGLPEGVRDAAAEALWEADRYPDPLCRALRRAIAAEEEVEEEMVLCGCGGGGSHLACSLGAAAPAGAGACAHLF